MMMRASESAESGVRVFNLRKLVSRTGPGGQQGARAAASGHITAGGHGHMGFTNATNPDSEDLMRGMDSWAPDQVPPA